jgi:hypothetical protein
MVFVAVNVTFAIVHLLIGFFQVGGGIAVEKNRNNSKFRPIYG